MKIRNLGNGIEILNLPKSGRQRIPLATIERHKDHVTLTKEAITFTTIHGDVKFPIVQEPGRYCLTCGIRLPDHGGNGTMLESQRAKECLEHVASHGKDVVDSDEWPHGYSNRPLTFDCTIEDLRHG
jgi:hypothetical protein